MQNFRQYIMALLEALACTLHTPNGLSLCWREDKHTGINKLQHVGTVHPFPIQQLEAERLSEDERGSLQYRFQHPWEPDGLKWKTPLKQATKFTARRGSLFIHGSARFYQEETCRVIETKYRKELKPPMSSPSQYSTFPDTFSNPGVV